MLKINLKAIQRLELYSRKNPLGFKIRIFLIALYGFFIVLLFAVLGIAAAGEAINLIYPSFIGLSIFTLKLAIPLIIFSFVILRILAVGIINILSIKCLPADGLIIQRAQAPLLFKEIDYITSHLKTPKLHTVILDMEFNAGILQRPRFGIMGLYENCLCLGIPLMYALTPDEYRAILAHEFAHLYGKGRFNTWLGAVSENWENLYETIEAQDGLAARIICKFIDSYLPIFYMHIYILKKANEFEADRLAMKLVGREIMTQALTRSGITDILIDKTVRENLQEARYQKQGNQQNFLMNKEIEALRKGPSLEDSRIWLEAALNQESSIIDTHPSVGERLRTLGLPCRLGVKNSIGESLSIPGPIQRSAGDYYLNDQAGRLLRLLQNTQ